MRESRPGKLKLRSPFGYPCLDAWAHPWPCDCAWEAFSPNLSACVLALAAALPPPQEFAFVPLMASSVSVVSLTFAWKLPHPGAWGKRVSPLPIAWRPWPVPEQWDGVWPRGLLDRSGDSEVSQLQSPLGWSEMGQTDGPPPSFPPSLRLENAPPLRRSLG